MLPSLGRLSTNSGEFLPKPKRISVVRFDIFVPASWSNAQLRCDASELRTPCSRLSKLPLWPRFAPAMPPVVPCDVSAPSQAMHAPMEIFSATDTPSGAALVCCHPKLLAAPSVQKQPGAPIRQCVKQACQAVAKICHFSTPAVGGEPPHH